MIGFIGTSLQLQSIVTVHTLNSFWMTSVWRISPKNLSLLSEYRTGLYSQSRIRVESYVTTDGQSASLSWNKAPIWGLRPDFYYQTVAGLFIPVALSDERVGLSFTIAAGSRQRSHSRVPAPWDSWQYITVSDSRLAYSSPPTTRRATVEVYTTSTRVNSRI
jgi:hypothetical protein